jgi:hypothetical protein
MKLLRALFLPPVPRIVSRIEDDALPLAIEIHRDMRIVLEARYDA